MDLEEERTEGNAVAMPQLISVLAAMVLVFGAWEKVIERKESLEYEGVVVGFGRNLKVDCYWLKEGNNSFAIGPHGYIWEGDTGYCVLGVLFVWWRFEFAGLEKK